MRDLTDDVALMRPVLDALRASGTDPDRVLARVGLPPGGLPAGRFPHSAQALFWKAAIDECGEEHVGLYLAQHLPAFHGLLLEYLFLSSETFGEGLRHALRYIRLLSDTLNAKLEVQGERAVLVLGLATGTPRHFPEMLAGAVIRLFSALTEGDFIPYEVQFIHAEGAPAELYQQVYGCPARFGCERYTLVFNAAVLDKTSRHAAPELLRMHESLARRQLAEVERLDLVRKVGFGAAYSFKYSARPGTPAAEKPAVETELADAWLHVLQALIGEQQRASQTAMIGREVGVLYEKAGRQPGQMMGKSDHLHAVHVADPQGRVGELVRVRISASSANSLAGVRISE